MKQILLLSLMILMSCNQQEKDIKKIREKFDQQYEQYSVKIHNINAILENVKTISYPVLSTSVSDKELSKFQEKYMDLTDMIILISKCDQEGNYLKKGQDIHLKSTYFLFTFDVYNEEGKKRTDKFKYQDLINTENDEKIVDSFDFTNASYTDSDIINEYNYGDIQSIDKERIISSIDNTFNKLNDLKYIAVIYPEYFFVPKLETEGVNFISGIIKVKVELYHVDSPNTIHKSFYSFATNNATAYQGTDLIDQINENLIDDIKYSIINQQVAK